MIESQINREGKNIPEESFHSPIRPDETGLKITFHVTPVMVNSHEPHGYSPPCNALLTQWGGGGSMY
jgi:hypothetical protein